MNTATQLVEPVAAWLERAKPRAGASVELRSVSHAYGTRVVLDDLNVTIEKGEIVAIVGPSGCGKSTLLSLLAGLAHPSRGAVACDGEIVSGPSRERALVFQDAALFPWLTALANIEYPLRSAGISRREIRARAIDALRAVELDHGVSSLFPYELSGGMRQRVGLARALVSDPRVLLMDEPFAALDPRTRASMRSHVQRLIAHTKKTLVLVTHSVDEAVTMADRIVVLSSSPARITRIISVSDRNTAARIIANEFEGRRD